MRALVHASCLAALLFAGTVPAQVPTPGAAPRARAIVRDEYGPPEILRLADVERCVPEDDQVRVRVRAAAVNPLDSYMMRGTPYLVRVDGGLLTPKTPRLGVDLAGQVEAVGRNVARFKPGDEVFGHRLGAFGEYACARERSLASKPANVTFEQAAGVAVAGTTALQALRDAGKLQRGQKVLVNGASGGVGTFAVQIAKAMGAHVTGVCSTRNVELVRSLGADRVIDYTREDFTNGGERYDLVVDMHANHALDDVRRVLSPDGRYVLVGMTEKGRWLKALLPSIKAAIYSRFVSQQMGSMLARIDKDDLATLAELMHAGKVTPVVDRRYPLREVPEAIRYVETGRARGKVVITMADDAAASPGSTSVAAAPRSTSAAGPLALALVALAVVAGPIVGALALNRRFQRRNPGKRPYRWGYYVAIMAALGGVLLAVVLEAGAAVATTCIAVYAVLAWAFARRRRWAWVALTVLSFNPLAWIVNLVYLRKRWAEDASAAPVPAR